jgi:hypothetical protein
LIVQGSFTLAFQTCIYRALIIISSLITYSFFISILPYYSAAYSVLLYVILHSDGNIVLYSDVILYIDGKFQYFSLSNILFPLPHLVVHSHRPPNTILLSLSYHMITYEHICIYVYI